MVAIFSFGRTAHNGMHQACKKINRSHTHTPTENTTSDTDTHTQQEQHPKPRGLGLPRVNPWRSSASAARQTAACIKPVNEPGRCEWEAVWMGRCEGGQ